MVLGFKPRTIVAPGREQFNRQELHHSIPAPVFHWRPSLNEGVSSLDGDAFGASSIRISGLPSIAVGITVSYAGIEVSSSEFRGLDHNSDDVFCVAFRVISAVSAIAIMTQRVAFQCS